MMNSAVDSADLEPAEWQQRAEVLAAAVCRRGLAAPAIFLLELYKPLTALGETAVIMGAPLLKLAVGPAAVAAAGFLERRDKIELLIQAIEAQSNNGRMR